MMEIRPGADPVGPRRAAVGVATVPDRSSAVSWSAILAGAVAAAALSLLLLILGTGLGLAAVSPWSMQGVSATTFGFLTIAWLSFTQLAASGMGGYLAGRLRTKWTGVHTNEVYFRDTAHGFLAWSVAAVVSAVALTSVAGSIVSGGVRAGAAVVGGVASTVGSVAGGAAGSAATSIADGAGSGGITDTMEYFVDSLFRADPAGSTTGVAQQGPRPERTVSAQNNQEIAVTQQVGAQQRETPATSQQGHDMGRDSSELPIGEVTRILAQGLQTGELPEEDERYIGQLIAQRSGLSQQEAEQRVSTGFERVQTTLSEAETAARETADAARKASAGGALWMFVSLLMGAFAASFTAVIGGRQRDA